MNWREKARKLSLALVAAVFLSVSFLPILAPTSASAQPADLPPCGSDILQKTIHTGSDFRTDGASGNQLINFRVKVSGGAAFSCTINYSLLSDKILRSDITRASTLSNARAFASYKTELFDGTFTARGKSFQIVLLVDNDKDVSGGFVQGVFFFDGREYIEKGAFGIDYQGSLGAVDKQLYASYEPFLKQVHDRFGEGNSRHVLGYRPTENNATIKYSEDQVRKWFDGLNGGNSIKGRTISIVETPGVPPSVTVPKSSLNQPGPRSDLVFKLISHAGEGAGGPGTYIYSVGNIDWLTFKAYVDEVEIDNLYLLVSDNIDANFIYDTDYAGLRKGKYSSATEIGSIYAQDNDDDAFTVSVGKYFTYAMNVPLNADGSVGGENCGQGYFGEEKTISTTGPEGKGADVTTTMKLEPPQNGRDARELNQNCVNKESTGWLQHWGLTQDNITSAAPYEGGDCGIKIILGAGGGGLGSVIRALNDCLISIIFIPVVEWAAKLIGDAAGISLVPNPVHIGATRPQQRC